MPEVREAVDKKADQMAEDLFDEHADAIEALPDDRRQEYRDINALAATPQVDRLGRPRTRIEDYVETDEDGQTTRAELVKLHLMSDENGDAPITKLNDWEGEVVEARDRPRRRARLGIATRRGRRPTRSASPTATRRPATGGRCTRTSSSSTRSTARSKASIVDPHGHHLEDSLVKLQALAEFAEDHGDAFHRIEALSKVGNVMKCLDMKRRRRPRSAQDRRPDGGLVLQLPVRHQLLRRGVVVSASGHRFRVYVIELDPTGLGDCGKGAVYVGETWHSAEERFAKHKAGHRAARVVTKRGVKLRPDLAPNETFETRGEALRAERRTANRLKHQGYRVYGGQGRRFMKSAEKRK